MLFFPFKADIKLSRFPILTILICILCLFIYWKQTQSEQHLYDYSAEFCQQQKGNAYQAVMKKLAAGNQYVGNDICSAVFIALNYSSNKKKQIYEMVSHTPKFSSKSLEQSHNYITLYLTKKSVEFEQGAPDNLSHWLSYEPDSFNIIKMITSAFAHGSWMHVIGNLFFFFAFAATVEALVGLIFYPLVIIALAIGTNLIYSLSVLFSPESVPTLGLSGVVMGTMGLFTYFVPNAYIRCFFWFFIIVRKFGIPAWLLAMWYFGWDVYDLYTMGNSGGVNLVAHVSGFLLGFLIGLVLFKSRKKEVHSELNRSKNNSQLAKAMGV